MSLRIVLADDHILVREGIKATLESNGLKIVGETSDGREAVRLATELQPDVAVFDIGMPGLNGIEATRTAIEATPTLRIVLLTVHAEDGYVGEAIRAGASGYVLKRQATTDLVRAIEEVSRGNMYLSPGVSRVVIDAVRSGSTAGLALTAREREVLQLIAEGQSTKQIGSMLGISAKTVETHRSRLMDKLEVRSVAGLVRYAIRCGLSSA